MMRLNLLANQRFAMVAIALLFTMHCQASLLDCAKIPGIDGNLQGECALGEHHALAPIAINTPRDTTPPKLLTRTGFQVNAPQSTSSAPDSLPLMVFFAGLLGVLLIRAKSCNTK